VDYGVRAWRLGWTVAEKKSSSSYTDEAKVEKLEGRRERKKNHGSELRTKSMVVAKKL
jgi:hypothetical protein